MTFRLPADHDVEFRGGSVPLIIGHSSHHWYLPWDGNGLLPVLRSRSSKGCPESTSVLSELRKEHRIESFLLASGGSAAAATTLVELTCKPCSAWL
jgi:hypothetical protein